MTKKQQTTEKPIPKKFFKTVHDRACAFAAFKWLEKWVKTGQPDGDLPVGEHAVGGHQVTVVLPDDLIVTKDGGTTGKGVNVKVMLQNSYGKAVIARTLQRLKPINHDKAFVREFLGALEDLAKAAQDTSLTEQYTIIDPEFEEAIAEFNDRILNEMPKRDEQAPRRVGWGDTDKEDWQANIGKKPRRKRKPK